MDPMMGANRTEEIKKTSYKEGRASKCGDSDKGGGVADPRYDNDEGGATGWFTHVNNLPGQQRARKA